MAFLKFIQLNINVINHNLLFPKQHIQSTRILYNLSFFIIRIYILLFVLQQQGRLSSVVERVAFNHVVVGSIPTDGVLAFFNINIVVLHAPFFSPSPCLLLLLLPSFSRYVIFISFMPQLQVSPTAKIQDTSIKVSFFFLIIIIQDFWKWVPHGLI